MSLLRGLTHAGSAVAVGLVINVVSVVAACLLVASRYNSLGRSRVLLLVAVLLAVPGAFTYMAFYSEGLFLLAVALTLWGIARRRFLVAAVGVALGSADRAIGVLLLVPLLLAVADQGVTTLRRVGYVAVSLAGIAAVMAVMFHDAGDPFAFVDARRGWGPTAGIVPFVLSEGPLALAHWLKAAIFFQPTQFVSQSMASAPLATGLGILEALAVIPLIVKAVRIEPREGAYAATAWMGSLLAGGIVSQARYMLVIVPVWAALVTWAGRRRLDLALVLGLVLAGWLTNMFLMTLFATCRWAG